MFPPLDEGQIRLILSSVGMRDIGTIEKLSGSFSNDVYSISDRYVAKFGKSDEDEVYLRREVYFVNLFRRKIPTAPIVLSDFTKRVIPRAFIVYKKIAGETLCSRWHALSGGQRKQAVLTIGGYLRIINRTPYKEYTEIFNVDTKRSWMDTVVARIEKDIRVAKNKNVFNLQEIELIDRYMHLHKDTLLESQMALTYYDPHFDNFLVDTDGAIMAMLDFERTEYASTDLVLDLIRRMVHFPDEYVSEKVKALLGERDCDGIWEWFQEGYPELFKFSDLKDRLNLYELDHDLSRMLDSPDNVRVRERILRKAEGRS